MKRFSKKTFFVLLVVVLLLLSSCNSSLPEENGTTVFEDTTADNKAAVSVPEEYQVYLLAASEEIGVSENLPPLYEGKINDPIVKHRKTNVPNKNITLFGRELELEYDQTVSSIYEQNDVDWYVYGYSGEGLLIVAFDEKTGCLRQYGDSLAGKNRSYKSEVEPKSSEGEFVRYAKNILSEYVSLDGYEMSISTQIIETSLKGEKTYQSGFVNLFERDPDVNVNYTFTFYKTICGLRRKDTISITLNNTGEISDICIFNYDEAYAQFENIKIDVEKLNNAVGISSGEYVLIVEDYALWAQVGVTVKTPDGLAESGLIYIVKVAELLDGRSDSESALEESQEKSLSTTDINNFADTTETPLEASMLE